MFGNTDRGGWLMSFLKRMTLEVGLVLVFVVCVSVALAQTDMKDRATTALGSVNTGGAIFDTTRMQNTATVFQSTTPPPEASITANTIQSETVIRLGGSGPENKVIANAQTRPTMTIDPADPRLNNGIWGSTSGVALMGDLQSGTARSCTYSDFGTAPPFTRQCDRYRNFTEPTCPVYLIVTAAGDTQDASACASLNSDPLAIPTDFTCTSGPATRTIAGVDETRLCWEWEQKFFLQGSGTFGNCLPYDSNPACSETATACMGASPDGTCAHELATFQCGNPSVAPPQNCQAIQVCTGTLCEGIPVQPDTNFASAATWLNMANDLAKNASVPGGCSVTDVANTGSCASGDVSFFLGERRICKEEPFKNCCTGGSVTDALGGCTSNEYEIIQAKTQKIVHYLGSYCSSSFLGICLERSRSFCLYNSKFARVFQQQYRAVSGTGWLGARDETCPGLTYTELQAVDLNSFDLSELYADMLASASIEDPVALEARILATMTASIGTPSGDITPSTNPVDPTAPVITDLVPNPDPTGPALIDPALGVTQTPTGYVSTTPPPTGGSTP